MSKKILLYLLAILPLALWSQDHIIQNRPIYMQDDLTILAQKKIELQAGFRVKPAVGKLVRMTIGEGGIIMPNVPKDGDTTSIIIQEIQNSQNITGETKFYHKLINDSKYTAVRIGEYLWMNKNLSDKLPSLWAEPWNQGTGWIGDGCNTLDLTQSWLDRDLDRLKLDKSQFQIKMEDFHKHYGRYYSRTDISHFMRRFHWSVFNRENLRIYEGKENVRTAWKMPHNTDFRQLFAMCGVNGGGVLEQIGTRKNLSVKAGENPLAFDINDPKGGMNYRTSWFESNYNSLGFNMMPGGSRLNNPGDIQNGLGPNNGAWPGVRGDIYHLFHTAKYATADSQVGIHDNLSTGQGMSWHWYNVRFCRELTALELGYRLYVNLKDYKENYEYTIKGLKAANVDIIKIGVNETPPMGYYELPKGYLRGFYVKYILNNPKPKTIEQIVEYLKKVDDDLFYGPIEAADSKRTLFTESTVQLYPNPVESILNVTSSIDEEIKSIEIYTIMGSRVLRKDNLSNNNVIDASKLAAGVHIVKIETDRGMFNHRIIKK